MANIVKTDALATVFSRNGTNLPENTQNNARAEIATFNDLIQMMLINKNLV